jgi:3'-phosphoadenosine 5'-phosphosulfate sulfotransferase (PAPS reductase)/FAD synthetase
MNPYIINEPTCISFSGGRTSGYMLYKIIEANDGLPKDAYVCYANTGKEEEATLRFIDRCSKEWGVKIHWVEYSSEDPKFRVVDFETASRNGEPFKELIIKRQYLPNPVTRFCTSELKIRSINKYLKSIGWTDHTENEDWIGIRADEPRRAAKIPDKSRIPLFVDGVTSGDVHRFWNSQSFNLELPSINGKTMHGNCDLCFLKPAAQILSLIQEKPERGVWWAEMESLSIASKPSGANFRNDRPSYKSMLNFSTHQTDMFDQNEEGIACFCGD